MAFKDPLDRVRGQIVYPQWTAPPVTKTGGYKWVLHDLVEDGIPDYIFPVNPNEMGSPFMPKSMQWSGLDKDGGYRGFQTTNPHRWEFGGILHTRSQYENLRQRVRRGNKSYLLDHMGRIWLVRPTAFEATRAGTLRFPWRHKYTLHLTTYAQIREPA